MARQLDEALVGVLRYLGELGYTEVYAGAATPESPVVSEPSRSRAVASPPEPPHASMPSSSAPPSSHTAAAPAAAVSSRSEDPAASLAAIGEKVAACHRCRLAQGRTKTVFGVGDPRARLMFIGEAPGADEDRQGIPFVGRAGELLTKIIEAIGQRRDTVYIANILKCRPPGNRDPLPDEVDHCREYLEGQLQILQPRVVVALGRIAAQTLLGTDQPIGQLRGRWYRFAGADMMVTYHPAALLRNQALKRPTWDDMQKVRDRLAQDA